MARSVLLQIVRDSIQEVLETKRILDTDALLKEHPLLLEPIPSTIKLYIDDTLRASSLHATTQNSLLKDIIYKAKKAAFEDMTTSPLTTSEYLHVAIELILDTPDGMMSEKDPPIVQKGKTHHTFILDD